MKGGGWPKNLEFTRGQLQENLHLKKILPHASQN
jgi:hypothetical protein